VRFEHGAASCPAERGAIFSGHLGAPNYFDDDTLAEEVGQGDHASFEALYERYHRSLLSYCRRMLRSRQDAEDAVQQTFLSAYEHLVEEDRPAHVKAWLYAIARNHCLMALRRRRRRITEPIELSTRDLFEDVQERSNLDELLADVRELPEQQRAALVLSELGDLSHADIGDVLLCDSVKVKSLVFQARSALVADRTAREIPCREIQRRIAAGHGWISSGATVRRHVRRCRSCARFYERVRQEQQATSLALPVTAVLALRDRLLLWIGFPAGSDRTADLAGGLVAQGAAAKLAAIAIAAMGIGIGMDASGTLSSSPGPDRQRSVAGPVWAPRTSAVAPKHGSRDSAGRSPLEGLVLNPYPKESARRAQPTAAAHEEQTSFLDQAGGASDRRSDESPVLGSADTRDEGGWTRSGAHRGLPRGADMRKEKPRGEQAPSGVAGSRGGRHARDGRHGGTPQGEDDGTVSSAVRQNRPLPLVSPEPASSASIGALGAPAGPDRDQLTPVLR
jgi:RNA polymerase sigma factor (sigma-70 family)